MALKHRSYPLTLGEKNRYGSSSTMFRKEIYWHTQPSPRTQPLGYVMQMGRITSVINTYEQSYDCNNVMGPPSYHGISHQVQQCYNDAYSSFVKNLKKDSSSLLNAYAERQKTVDGIAQRAKLLYSGFLAAKRGDVRTLKRLWGKGAGLRQNVKKHAGHVLEYSFGYAPLMSDIASSVAVLSNGVPPSVVRGGSNQEVSLYSGPRPGAGGYRLTNHNIGWRLRASVRIVNPNLALANQLGLNNPASTLWEITPWSFVVDYFVNVSDFIASYTDFQGFEISLSCATNMIVTQHTDYHFPTGNPAYNYGYTAEGVRIERRIGISSPTLTLRPPWKLSMLRALTSISLLIQQLK